MAKFLKRFLFLMMCSILLTACTNEAENQQKKPSEETKADNKNAETKSDLKLESPALPKNLEEVIAYPVGPYASKDTQVQDKDVQKALNAIPTLPKDADDQELNQLFSYLYSLFKMEYQDPKQALKANTISQPESGTGSKEQTQQTFNVEIILDSSGSMANKMGSKTRMELAKESIQKFASSLPKEANISLRVYGHKGTGSDSDKQTSCSANELVYSPQPYNQAGLDQALHSFKPAGWTPLAQSLMEAQKDLAQYTGENNKNIVYVVSDGIETCGGDPIAAAKSLKESGVAPVVNIIGFDLNNKDQKQLQEIANAAGGTYTNVKNQDQLQNEFDKTIEESLEWINWKNKQILTALNNKNGQTLDIIGLSNDWENNNRNEKYLIQFSLNDLQRKDKITDSQKEKLNKLREEFYDLQFNSVEELKKVLKNANEQNFDATRNKIDKIYKENVSQ